MTNKIDSQTIMILNDLKYKKKNICTHVKKPLFHMSYEEKKIYFTYIDIDVSRWPEDFIGGQYIIFYIFN